MKKKDITDKQLTSMILVALALVVIGCIALVLSILKS